LPAIREYAAAGPVYINPEREDSIRDAFAAAMRGETDWDQRVRIGLERARAITWQACAEKTAAVYQRFL
jgi:alpha-1,3-rhamnosyl/mannosyltransferase